MTPMFPRMERTVTRPRRPPSAPGDAAISEATLPTKHANGGSPTTGRDAQSMAFFSTAVMELLYSGAEMRNPS